MQHQIGVGISDYVIKGFQIKELLKFALKFQDKKKKLLFQEQAKKIESKNFNSMIVTKKVEGNF